MIHPLMLVQLREKKDEAATRERFWDVTQSKIGQLTGTTDKEQADAAAATDEANKLSVKFGGTVVNEEGVLVRLLPGAHILYGIPVVQITPMLERN